MGESIILWLQQFSSGLLDLFFGGVTYFGAETFYVVALPIIYWCISKPVGVRLALITCTSAFTNTALKETFMIPRPDPTRVRVILAETGGGYGFPSGHAQGTTTFWFTLVREFSRKWVLITACVVVFLVALSRLYLGVHYPTDVLGGFVLGLIFAIGGVALIKRVSGAFLRLSLPVQFVIALFLPLVLLLINRHESSIGMVANICGFSAGAIMEREWIGFREREDLPKQLLKIVLGLGILFGIKVGLKAVFPEGDLFRFIRYALIGFSGAGIVPYLFTRINLAGKQDTSVKM